MSCSTRTGISSKTQTWPPPAATSCTLPLVRSSRGAFSYGPNERAVTPKRGSAHDFRLILRLFHLLLEIIHQESLLAVQEVLKRRLLQTVALAQDGKELATPRASQCIEGEFDLPQVRQLADDR